MKKRVFEFIMSILLLIGIVVLFGKGQILETMKEETKKLIVIDPGHGGDDPGVVGIGGIAEKEINLKVAMLLKEELEKNGYKIIMTREEDKGLYQEGTKNKKVQDMQNRCKIIEDANPLCTISVHQNSYPEESVCGPQVFYFTHSSEGQKLAATIQKSLNENLDVNRPRTEKANATYYMLKRSASLTVIVECGFLSNSEEASKLVKEEYQQKVAEIISKGVLKYLEK